MSTTQTTTAPARPKLNRKYAFRTAGRGSNTYEGKLVRIDPGARGEFAVFDVAGREVKTRLACITMN